MGITIKKLTGITSRAILWVVVGIIALWVIYIIIDNQYTPSTKDAYLSSKTIEIAPQVSGRIIKLFVKNHQQVKAGDPLFFIDPATYQYDLQQAQSDLQSAKLKYQQLITNIAQAKTRITLKKAALENAADLYHQIKTLKNKGDISTTRFNLVQAQFLEAKANLLDEQQNLDKATQELGQISKGRNHLIELAEARVANAKIALEETKVYAPLNGYLTNIEIGKGTYGRSGETLLTLIANSQWWVVANYRENNLSRVKLGDKAYVSFAFLPNHVFIGHVKSIGWGVNLKEGMPDHYLPYIKSTHDWIKLPQRFPVDIEIDENQKDIPARVGASAHVTIITTPDYPFNFLASWTHHIRSFMQYIF